MRDRRIWILIVAALILAAVSVWRISTNHRQNYADQVAAAVVMRAAPGFEALDSDNHLVRLGSFLGRHVILVVFFDGDAGADNAPELIRIRDRFEELQAHNVKVVAVSSAIPQKNRAAMDRVGKFPFPLVSDIDPLSPDGNLRIHQQWGRIDPNSNKPRTGIFLIDRKGQVTFTVNGPRPMPGVDLAIDEAVGK